jgi:hypothetical protein
MLHSKEEWESQSGANERLIGGRDIIKGLIVIRKIRRTSRKELVRCFNRLNNRVRGQKRLWIRIRVTTKKIATMHKSSNKSRLLLHEGKHV